MGFFLIQQPHQCTPALCKILGDLLQSPFFLVQNVQISYIRLITLWMRVHSPSLRFTMASAITSRVKVRGYIVRCFGNIQGYTWAHVTWTRTPVGVHHKSLFVTACGFSTFCRHLTHLCSCWRFGSNFRRITFCSTFHRHLSHLCCRFSSTSSASCNMFCRHLCCGFGGNFKCSTFYRRVSCLHWCCRFGSSL